MLHHEQVWKPKTEINILTKCVADDCSGGGADDAKRRPERQINVYVGHTEFPSNHDGNHV